ncbi:hypothetical protein XELAEV_18034704mg [Xenopus laevis]|uniref:Uncharacterized protein n=1 Tax=Xenopus laevis TaxID=8355 RepID=A0A974CGK3_XENLA|nr:hypothetical protein XELAEV_18034704mg [Xenopus laevis]
MQSQHSPWLPHSLQHFLLGSQHALQQLPGLPLNCNSQQQNYHIPQQKCNSPQQLQLGKPGCSLAWETSLQMEHCM